MADSFSILYKAVAYIANASVESEHMSARSSANSARRALWLKTWSGDPVSKLRLCGLPVMGDLVFGSQVVLYPRTYFGQEQTLPP